jgi:hypothetical protein
LYCVGIEQVNSCAVGEYIDHDHYAKLAVNICGNSTTNIDDYDEILMIIESSEHTVRISVLWQSPRYVTRHV